MDSQARILGFLLILLVHRSFGVNIEFNMTQYYQMPTLNRFDNYHECMGTFGSDALYCVADTFIKPDLDSELYKFIKEYSRDTKKHFRHDNLVRGLCVNSCKEIVEKLGIKENEYYVEKFPIDSKILFDTVNYHYSKEDRVKYADVINKCVNLELIEKYNLKGYSSIEYCLSEYRKPPLDALDIFVALLIASIFSIVIVSSLFDRVLRNISGCDAETHYKGPLETKRLQILTLFSVRRNWNILSAPTSDEFQDLQFLHAIKTLSMSFVIFGHICYFAEFLPSYNPEVNEGGYSSIPAMIIFNGLQTVQSFLVMSGFLLTYLFLSRKKYQNESSISIFFKSIILRYIRFAPLQAITLLIHATWLFRMGNGPIFNKTNYAEQEFCRKHWWKNMLFIDNYTNGDEKCLIQTWYLDCDFWLSVAGILYLLIIRKIPSIKTLLLSCILALSSFMIGYTVYVENLEPNSIFPPETLKNRLAAVTDDDVNYYKVLYIPTHLNMGNYFTGVALGLIFYEFKKTGRSVHRIFTFRVIWYICIILGFANLMSGHIFYNYDLEKPSILVSIIAMFLKQSWGFLVAFMLFGLIYQYGWFVPGIFSHPGWRITGRISFAGYIFHNIVVQLLIMDIYQPIYMDTVKFIALAMGATFICILVGLFFVLSVEIPVASIVKIVMNQQKPEVRREITLDVITESTPMKASS